MNPEIQKRNTSFMDDAQTKVEAFQTKSTLLNDADSLIAHAKHDPNAFAGIFDMYFDDIYRYVARRVDETSASDLAGTVFCIAFEKRFSYEPGRSGVRAWLFGIATNVLHHHWRREQRKSKAYHRFLQHNLDAQGEPYSEGNDKYARVDERIDADKVGKEVKAALEKISLMDRDVILLYAWADLSYQEIAESLDIPVGTVRSRLHRVRRNLRELLSHIGEVHDIPQRIDTERKPS